MGFISWLSEPQISHLFMTGGRKSAWWNTECWWAGYLSHYAKDLMVHAVMPWIEMHTYIQSEKVAHNEIYVPLIPSMPRSGINTKWTIRSSCCDGTHTHTETHTHTMELSWWPYHGSNSHFKTYCYFCSFSEISYSERLSNQCTDWPGVPNHPLCPWIRLWRGVSGHLAGQIGVIC